MPYYRGYCLVHPGFILYLFSFIALIPLLFLADEIENSGIKRKKLRAFLLSYLAFLLWNICDTWWIWFASDGGAVAAFVANSLLMALVYLLFSRFAADLKTLHLICRTGCLFLCGCRSSTCIPNGTWPGRGFNLGNVFAFEHNWIQWYEYTGVSGGTLWILAVNIMMYQAIRFKIQQSKIRIAVAIVVVLLPIGISTNN